MFIIMLITVAMFILTTTPGLYLAIKLASLTLPGKIRIGQLQGRLIDKIIFKDISYTDNNIDIVINKGHLNWQPKSLLSSILIIDRLELDEITVHRFKLNPNAPIYHQRLLTLPTLPFNLKITEAKTHRIIIKQEKKSYVLQHLKFQTIIDQIKWQIPQLIIDYHDHRLSLIANGDLTILRPLKATLTVRPTHKKRYSLSSNINVDGNASNYQWHGTFNGIARGFIQGNLYNSSDIHSKISWRDLNWPTKISQQIHSSAGQLIISGTLADLLMDLNMRLAQPLAAELAIHTRIHDRAINLQATMHTAHGEIEGHLHYDQHHDFSGDVIGNNLDLAELGWPIKDLHVKSHFIGHEIELQQATNNIVGSYFNSIFKGSIDYNLQNVKGELHLDKNHLSINGKAPFQWQLNAFLGAPELLHPTLTGLKTALTARATIHALDQGKIQLTLAPGTYHLPRNNNRPLMTFQGGKLSAILSEQALLVAGQLTIDQQKYLKLRANLPTFKLNRSIRKQKIDGNLTLNINSIDCLQVLNPNIDKLQGQLLMQLQAEGLIRKPKIRGKIELHRGSMVIPKLNLNLNPISATLTSINKQWKLDGKIQSKNQTLHVNGQGQFSPEVRGTIHVNGDNFPLMNTAESTFSISPQVMIDLQPKSLTVSGNVLVPSAQLKPLSFSNTIDLSEDAVFIDDKPLQSHFFDIKTDIQLKMGTDVKLAVKGLHGYLDGALRIKQFPQGEPFATGELTIRDGRYHAYGQNLAIEQGQLIFTGGMLANPLIRIRAIRHFTSRETNFVGSNQLFDFNTENTQSLDFGDKTTVGIAISGRLNATKIRLFAIPSNLSQADILSMIILGRPASLASQSGGQLLLTALNSMNLDSGSKGLQLMEQLKNNLGIDLNVQESADYKQKFKPTNSGAGVVVGKSLSKRAYVSYNIGLFEKDNNVFTLKYLLNKFFSIQVTASTSGNGIDLLYTHSKD
ncbi:MAG: translocation/assembly module TamB domain-containing protein [Legionella sp.]